MHEAPHLSLYHRARICGLLAKHGDDADIEVADYAMECISHAQSILRHESPQEGSNAWQALEDLILDARETIQARCPEVQIPADILANVQGEGFDVDEYDEWHDEEDGSDSEECDEDGDGEGDENEDQEGNDEQDENEGDDEEDENEDQEGDGQEGDGEEGEEYEEDGEDGEDQYGEDDEEYEEDGEDQYDEEDEGDEVDEYEGYEENHQEPMDISMSMSVDIDHSALRIPPNHALTTGYSTSAPAPDTFEEVAFDVDPQDIRSLGLILTLLVRDRAGMEAAVLGFARSHGLSDEQIEEIVQKAYVPRKKVPGENGLQTSGDLMLSEFLFSYSILLIYSLSLRVGETYCARGD